MESSFNVSFVVIPLILLLIVGLYIFTLKMPNDLGIYLGWLPSLVFLLLTIFSNMNILIFLIISIVIYVLATFHRIENNKKLKKKKESNLKELDKMSINDL